MGIAAWIKRLFGRKAPSMDLVPFYDASSGRVIRIPSAELAPGVVRASVKGIDGIVWVIAGQAQQGPLRHPPASEEMRDYLRRIQETFAEHRPLTLEEWEDGFRRDLNANREIALWIHAANVYQSFASNEPSRDRRHHLYAVIIACLTSSAVMARKVSPPGSLSPAEMDLVIQRFFGAKEN